MLNKKLQVVEDGFSLEEHGYNVKKYIQYFKGMPKSALQRLLKHFRDRQEWEVCKVLRQLIQSAEPQARFA